MNPVFTSIRPTNFLSYGPSSPSTELKALNVIIGPNASGKSNLIEAFSLLRAAPSNVRSPLKLGGGAGAWLSKHPNAGSTAMVSATLSLANHAQLIRYSIGFAYEDQRFRIVEESVQGISSDAEPSPATDYYRFDDGRAKFLRLIPRIEHSDPRGPLPMNMEWEDVNPSQSVLAQRKGPIYSQLSDLGSVLSRIMIYRNWGSGPDSRIRQPQPTDSPNDFLAHDGSNLGLILNSFELFGGAHEELMRRVRRVIPLIEKFSKLVQGGTIQVFAHERWVNEPIPAVRLSDGTLRFLCLASILCHPSPPPLVCIEEPEIGLHPDALLTLAEMLVDASTRTQLVVTTHSDLLVSKLSETPESVIVCERDPDGSSSLRRLEPDKVAKWLEDYSLGELWLSGELGGTL